MVPLLLACSPLSLEAVHPDSVGTTEDSIVDSTPDSEEVPSVSEAPEPFGLDRVHQVEITLSSEAIASLGQLPYEHVQAGLSFDGEALPNPVALRIKGRYGSYRALTQKSGFKIDLDRFGDQDLFGLEHLNINNMVQDSTQLHDFMAYEVYRAMGVPCPWVGYAWVQVNGTPYGLYALVEDYDKKWVKARFEEDDGNLYDGDYWLAPDWSWYQLLDFDTVSQDYFQLDEGQDVGHADIRAITAALDGLSDAQRFDETLDGYLVMDEYIRLWAVETWVGQYDGYNFNKNNYRLYFDPSDGRAWMMGWDHDWSFYQQTPVTTPVSRLAQGCMADASCAASYHAAIDELCDERADMGLDETLERVRDLIQPYVRDDPRRETDLASIGYYQDELGRWFRRRCGELSSMGI